MGRKIPSKKHRGVKDPLKQQAQRFQSIKDKINAPPTDPDEQPVPKSLQRLFAFQEPRAPASKVKKKKSRSLPAIKRTGNPVAALKRMPGEAGRAFSMRINSAVRALHNTDQEDYPSDLDEADTRGEYIASQRMRRQRKHRQAVAKGAAGAEGGRKGEGERLSKTQRRALKKKEQQKSKEAETWATRELEARELRYERVAFGEVAHAPPTLALPLRAQAQKGAPRPGRRDLLLANMLKPGATSGNTAGQKSKPKPPPVTAAEHMRRERARLEAVDAYRALKKQRAAEKEKSR